MRVGAAAAVVVTAVLLFAAPAGATVCSSAPPVVGQACSAAGVVAGGVATGAAGAAAGITMKAASDAALAAMSSWSADGATWLIDQVGPLLDAGSRPPIGTEWFGRHYRTMAGLAALLVLPLLLLALATAAVRRDPSAMVRAVAVHLPVACLVTGAGVALVRLLLDVTDAMCAAVTAGTGADATKVVSSVARAASGVPGLPPFVGLLTTMIMGLAAFLLLLELTLRSAAISLAVLFLPLSLAGLVWPMTAHWWRRLAEVLAALILSKFVVVAVLSLAAGALAGGSAGPGYAGIVTGVALLLLAVAAPYAILRLIPVAESGAVGHLEAVTHRARSAVPTPSLASLPFPEPPLVDPADSEIGMAIGDIPYSAVLHAGEATADTAAAGAAGPGGAAVLAGAAAAGRGRRRRSSGGGAERPDDVR